MSESLHPFQIGDIVCATNNSEYLYTHPRHCFFGMVSNLYPYNDEDNIEVFTMHFIENFRGVPTPQTIDVKELVKQPEDYNPSDVGYLKPYQRDIVFSISTQVFPRYAVNAAYFQRIPDVMDLEFQQYYYEYFAGQHFPDHDFESFQRSFLKPFVDLHNQFNNMPQPLLPLSLDKSL